MAEQVPYGVATSVINTLASLAFREIASIYGVQSEIDKIKQTVEFIKAALADADQKQQNGNLIQLWIKKLKQVLYKADDLFDELHTQHLLRKRDGKGKVRDFFSSSNPIAFRHKIARKIKKIREQFNAIADDACKLNLDRKVDVMSHNESSWRETSSLVYQEDIVGREENKKEIIDLLLTTKSNQNVSLVAIVGMGGLGKTALAQLVYNDTQVKSFFKKQMWVCVSEDFDVKVLVKKILESLVDHTEEDQQLELLQNKLQQNLNGQRFLLVLDDIWNEDPEKWQHLKKYLKCGGEGSKILLTTRNQTVVTIMGVKMPYILKGLTNDQSWTLLKRLAFEGDEVVNPNLESIGQKIAKKCAGVPLAVRAIGSLLQSKSKESDWEAILEGDFWMFSEDNNSIMPILKLSYHSLTIELKQCFAYCSLYPKDWRYKKDKLIELWMAQGYLECQDVKQCPEDVGEQYVHILLMKSFFQDVEMNEFGEIEYFKMHDLMHDLSLLVTDSDFCLDVEDRKDVAVHPMHVSFRQYNSNWSLDMLDGSRLRTILDAGNVFDQLNLLLFKRLRSLDLSWDQMRDLPKSIGKLNHLRYLDLSYCFQLTSLPKSISNLVNLETLKLDSCFSLEFSIDFVTKLINLHHLDVSGCKAFENGMPIGLDRMTSLQSLPCFIVGNDKKKSKKAKLNELKELNLKHRLAIDELGLVRDVEEESKDVNLKTKKNLMSLTLDWGSDRGKVKNSDTLQLLENLCPHPNLKQLEVKHYPGVRLSGWLLSLKNLVELSIGNCENCQYLPALEGFVSLKTLQIETMNALQYICYEGCSLSMVAHCTANFFPSLEELEIRGCPNLTGWQREADVDSRRDSEKHHSLPPFSRLSHLSIVECPNLSCMPTFPNLVRKLELSDCNTKLLADTLKVRTIGTSTSQELDAPLSMLKHLDIGKIDIEALPEKWMQNLTSLQRLSIGGLLRLVKLFCHMRHLSATIEEFDIQRVDSLDSWGSDEDYRIQYDDLRCLHSLQTINFLWCQNLEALPNWICDLHSLRFILIHCCDKLESLPEGMHRLTNLQTLALAFSPLLEERCKRDTGAEWRKIAHIPKITVNGHQI